MRLIKSQWIREAGTLRFHERDIILVLILSRREIQPYYRSSGLHSHMPGKWLPFDGVLFGHWFDKARFTENVDDNLFRFGTTELRDISEELGQLEIHRGLNCEDPQIINDWIVRWKQLNKH